MPSVPIDEQVLYFDDEYFLLNNEGERKKDDNDPNEGHGKFKMTLERPLLSRTESPVWRGTYKDGKEWIWSQRFCKSTLPLLPPCSLFADFYFVQFAPSLVLQLVSDPSLTNLLSQLDVGTESPLAEML
jgi:hypothetical protein